MGFHIHVSHWNTLYNIKWIHLSTYLTFWVLQDALANGQQNGQNQNPFAMGFSAYFIYIVVYRYKIVGKVVMDIPTPTHTCIVKMGFQKTVLFNVHSRENSFVFWSRIPNKLLKTNTNRARKKKTTEGKIKQIFLVYHVVSNRMWTNIYTIVCCSIPISVYCPYFLLKTMWETM